jgi:acyl-CoA reductase-like NAD-dependent aldehyde dehydrogenase
MRRLTDQQVDQIARELAGRLGAGTPPTVGQSPRAYGIAPDVLGTSGRPAAVVDPALMSRHGEGDGVFNTVDDCIEAARAAFHNLNAATLAKRTDLIAAIREAMLREGDDLARQAWQETGLGRYEDKIIKNRLVTEKTPGTEALQPETTTGDNGLTLMEWAPFGVIGAITPTTNPTSTIICNVIGMLAAGNSVVFNVHPGAASCSMATVRAINQAVIAVGGPANLVTAVAQPTIASATELMHHKGINLLVVTGGPGVVKAAMKSGKRSVSAGPGNPPVVVDATADLAKAGRDIVTGASFDNNIICVDEKQVFVVASVADALLKEMRSAGAYLVDQAELRRLEKVIFDEIHGPRTHGVINKKWVGKNADLILAEIGVRVGPEVRLVIADVPEDHPLVWSEQLMPVLPIVRVPDVDRGIALAKESEHGFGHSASMHSRDIDALSRMARTINTSIFVKNGPIVAGLGAGGEGFTSFTIASPTGEGLTSPVSFSRRRRCVMVDHFRIV